MRIPWGYFAKQRNRRGRQLGRVLATRYGEVLVDRLFEGNKQLAKALAPLMEAAEQTLGLDQRKRQRTRVAYRCRCRECRRRELALGARLSGSLQG